MVHFSNLKAYHAGRYDEQNDPTNNLIECQALRASQPKYEWVHAFVHTLDEMLRYWYVAVELWKTITTSELSVLFAQKFSFWNDNPKVHNALQIIRDIVLKVVPVT